MIVLGVTCNNQRALDGTPGPVQGPVDRNDVVDFDVSAHITGDDTCYFAITSDSDDGVDDDSREARAELIVK